MKQRIKVTCCSHATPDGKAIMGKEEKLSKKLDKGVITVSEMWEYAELKAKQHSSSPTVRVRVFGKMVAITRREYNEIYKPLGFKAL